jgi:hypothetical protein
LRKLDEKQKEKSAIGLLQLLQLLEEANKEDSELNFHANFEATEQVQAIACAIAATKTKKQQLTLHKLHQTQFPSWDRDGPDLTSRSSQRSRSSTRTPNLKEANKYLIQR